MGEAEVEEPDSHFEWLSPDEAVRLPFSRSRDDAVQLAVQYDLCFGGDALHHVEQIGAAPLFVPLTQVRFRYSRKTPQFTTTECYRKCRTGRASHTWTHRQIPSERAT